MMILEPNLIELPRSKRLIRENGRAKRLETVRIVETVSRYDPDSGIKKYRVTHRVVPRGVVDTKTKVVF